MTLKRLKNRLSLQTGYGTVIDVRAFVHFSIFAVESTVNIMLLWYIKFVTLLPNGLQYLLEKEKAMQTITEETKKKL